MKPHRAGASLKATAVAVAVCLTATTLLAGSHDAFCARSTNLFFLSGGGSDKGGALPPADTSTGSGTSSACPSAADVAASPWARSCELVTKVCVDSGR